MVEEGVRVRHISFNTEGTAFLVATTHGIVAYDTDPLRRKFSVIYDPEGDIYQKQGKELAAAELISNTNYIVVAYNATSSISELSLSSSSSSSSSSSNANSTVAVYNVSNATCINERSLPEPITCMKVLYNPDTPKLSKLCIGTPDRVVVYNIHEEAELLSVRCTPQSLSISARDNILVTENNKEVVVVKDFGNVLLRKELNVHSNSEVSAVSWSGRMVASASTTGTVLKVIDLECPDIVIKYRRGSSNGAKITSMSFSRDDKLLAVSSDRNTIHIFKLGPKPRSFFSIDDAVPALIDIKPDSPKVAVPTEMISFSNSVVSFCSENELAVITSDGTYLIYEINVLTKNASLKKDTRPTNLTLLEL